MVGVLRRIALLVLVFAILGMLPFVALKVESAALTARGVSVPDVVPGAPAAPRQITYTVEITDFQYLPPTLTVAPGDTVVWTNLDVVSHTVTSTDTGPLDSGLLGLNESYTHTFTTTGIFPYFCTVHPNMLGTIEVAQQAVLIYLPIVIGG